MFSYLTFGNSTFKNLTFGNSTFDNATFGKSTFGNSTFDNSTFGNLTFGNSTFGNSTVGNPTFANCILICNIIMNPRRQAKASSVLQPLYQSADPPCLFHYEQLFEVCNWMEYTKNSAGTASLWKVRKLDMLPNYSGNMIWIFPN